MGLDKKVEQGRLRLILLERIGKAFVTADFPRQALEEVLAQASHSAAPG
jgi:3-dehydroquinate synthase